MNPKILIIYLSIFAFQSCESHKLIAESSEVNLKIISLDSITLENYYIFKFKTKPINKGNLLIEKKDSTSTRLISMFHQKRFEWLVLCDVIEFKLDGESATLRSQGANNRIYIDNKFVLDLSDEAKEKYYRLCSNPN